MCRDGACVCVHGYGGSSCQKKVACADDCNGRGACVEGECKCAPGFAGDTCSVTEGVDVPLDEDGEIAMIKSQIPVVKVEQEEADIVADDLRSRYEAIMAMPLPIAEPAPLELEGDAADGDDAPVNVDPSGIVDRRPADEEASLSPSRAP